MSQWQFAEPTLTPLQAQELASVANLGPLATQVCINRGLTTAEQIQEYLNPRLEKITHPFKILDLEKAADYILAGQIAKKKIRVFTDYDVDGTTGAALLTWFFRDMGFLFDVTQPDRFKDGYGLNPGAIDQALQDGIDTLITVDCGITNFEAAERAQELGINLIIVDHHLIDPSKGLPPAYAVIDPQRDDDQSGLKQLCGCALAFYLSMGIRIKAREQGWFTQNPIGKNVKEPNLKDLLDLVVIATAADMVPLVGDNRILVKQGLDILRNTQKPGLHALIERAGIEVKTVSPMSLGFALGPRINASGRMGSAETAYRCLTTQNEEEGRALANELEGINKSRATLQNQIWDQVRAQVEDGIRNGKYSHAIVVASSDWHEGVVGIVASRVTEHFKKPAVVLAIREDGIAKGSVRSYGGYNILEALHMTKNLLKGYGGHKFAAGLSFLKENLDEFVAAYNQAIATLLPEKDRSVLKLEGTCVIQDLNPTAIAEIERLGPFGPGNHEPLFAVEAWVESQSVLKGRHIKLKLANGAQKSPQFKIIEGIWFNAAERLEWSSLMENNAQLKKCFRFAGIPELNRFQGRVTPTLRIKDIQI